MGVIKSIFNDYWDQFVTDHPKMIRDSVHKEVNVKTFDEMDQSNINEPPQFDCETCGD